MPLSSWDTGVQKFNEWKSQNSILSLSETKTNFKNELKSAASLILTFPLPISQHYHIHQNAPPAFAKSLIESHKSNKAFDRCKQIKSTQAISSDIQTKQIFCQQSQSRYWPRHWLSTLAKAQFHHYLHKEQIMEPIVNCRSENWKLAASSIDSLYRALTALTAFASCWQLSKAVNSRSWSFNKLGNIGQTLTCVVEYSMWRKGPG